MRKIKFRGIITRSGQFTTGNLVKEMNGTAWISRHFHSGEWESVEPETVGEFTGLTDKNGVEIYEGDIIKFTSESDEIYNSEIAVCVFEQQECNFVLQRKVINPANYPVPTTIRTIYLISDCTSEYEVIGNVHQTKEV